MTSRAYVVTRHRKSLSGTVTVSAFGPYAKDEAERVRQRAILIEMKRPVLARGWVHVAKVEPRVSE